MRGVLLKIAFPQDGSEEQQNNSHLLVDIYEEKIRIKIRLGNITRQLLSKSKVILRNWNKIYFGM